MTANPQTERIRPAGPDEGDRLRDIAFHAKSHWGYDRDMVREWTTTGDFAPEAMARKDIFVAEVAGQAVGWAAVFPKGDVCWLDDLWVEPGWMGRGIGARLFRHAAEHGRRQGAQRMEWEAEPNALGFYERMGGCYLRDSEPSPWGRINAVMGVDLGG